MINKYTNNQINKMIFLWKLVIFSAVRNIILFILWRITVMKCHKTMNTFIATNSWPTLRKQVSIVMPPEFFLTPVIYWCWVDNWSSFIVSDPIESSLCLRQSQRRCHSQPDLLPLGPELELAIAEKQAEPGIPDCGHLHSDLSSHFVPGRSGRHGAYLH